MSKHDIPGRFEREASIYAEGRIAGLEEAAKIVAGVISHYENGFWRPSKNVIEALQKAEASIRAAKEKA